VANIGAGSEPMIPAAEFPLHWILYGGAFNANMLRRELLNRSLDQGEIPNRAYQGSWTQMGDGIRENREKILPKSGIFLIMLSVLDPGI